MGEWVFTPQYCFEKKEVNTGDIMDEDFFDSLNDNAAQNWRTPTEFLCCPKLDEEQSLEQYLKNLEPKKIFSKNKYGSAEPIDFGISPDKTSIIVALNVLGASIKQWKLVEIQIEDGIFYHGIIGAYFQEDGLIKYFTLAMGKEWIEGEVFDDFC